MEPEPTDRRVSVRDMAKQLGVSHSAVSLALRNSTQVSEKLRENVRQLAEELGYQPDPMLTALSNYRRGKSTKPVQSVIAWINAWKRPGQLRESKECDAYWAGTSHAARKLGYRLEEIRMGADLAAAPEPDPHSPRHPRDPRCRLMRRSPTGAISRGGIILSSVSDARPTRRSPISSLRTRRKTRRWRLKKSWSAVTAASASSRGKPT